MPIPLNGNTPAANLQAIVARAREHGTGTMYVGSDQVSHRTAWGRVFKSNPVDNQTSINNYKSLLIQAYPEGRVEIEALLADSYRTGRLTAGAVDRTYRQVEAAVKRVAIEAEKYRITYPDDLQGREARLRFEDQRALTTLQNPESIRVVCDCALKLADHIEQSAAFTDDHARAFLKGHLARQALYPVHPEARRIPRDKAGIVDFLRTTARGNAPDRQVLLLSMMWALPKNVGAAEDLKEVKVIDRLYSTKVYQGKQHIDLRQQMISLFDIGARLAQSIDTNAGFSDEDAVALVHKHLAAQAQHLSRPDPDGLPTNKAELIEFLSQPLHPQQPDRCLLAAEIMKDVLDGSVSTKSSGDYKKLVTNQKPISGLHRFLVQNQNDPAALARVAGAVTRSGTFGNTEIASDLMNRFSPHQKESEAVQVIESPNAQVRKFLDAGYPYVSGSSGMANCGSTLYPLLKLDMTSEDGKLYGEALAAFIVGAGEHSYREVYKSLNLSLRYLHFGQALTRAEVPAQNPVSA